MSISGLIIKGSVFNGNVYVTMSISEYSLKRDLIIAVVEYRVVFNIGVYNRGFYYRGLFYRDFYFRRCVL